MTNPQYRIAGLSAWKDEFACLMEPLLVAAVTLGHQARRIAIGKDSADKVLEIVKATGIDVCFLTGRTVHYCVMQAPSLLPTLHDAGVPVVILWYDNPLRYLDDIASVYTENVLLLTSIDTKCLGELKTLGFNRVGYFPIWSLTPNFKPAAPEEAMRCELSFAGGHMSREYFETLYLPSHLPHQFRLLFGESSGRALWWELIEGFLALRQRTKRHVDVFEYLRVHAPCGPLTDIFHALSSLLMQYQKILEREQLFEAVHNIPDATLHCYGGADVVVRNGEVTRSASAWDRVAFHPALDKRTELQRLYNATEINLGLSQFPRAVHNRYFECAACGGFMIGEYKEDLEGLFEVGREIVCFRDLDELPELIRFYRARTAERRRIGAAARERHLKQHTPAHRMRLLLPLVERELERFRDLHKVMA